LCAATSATAPRWTERSRAHRVDTIVNFAAETHVDRSIMDPDAFIQTDVYGVYVLLEAARKARQPALSPDQHR
jgi:dTDP-D-glucose 4,6-dehydratase